MKILNKARQTHLPIPKIENTQYIRGLENDKQGGILSEFSMTKYPGRKWYDDFNFVNWFNNKI